MASTEERVRTLEVRVDRLETWAGPGQVEAFAEGQRAIRADLAGLKRAVRADIARLQLTQDRQAGLLADLTSDVTTLKADVTTLKADMAEVKETLREVLRRLPEAPVAS